ncbi:MAG: winged helix-turn-helix transcriptional regulator [Thermoplasmata archaeon]|nr:winged helix-turn-helix transcriptional regulator [Thermoplasmata archaeon]
MDDLDLDIYRWMYPGGVFSMYGVDPRITTSDIAPHVGLTRTAVWARIRQWERDGFWKGLRVHPNPTIFGEKIYRVEIPVADTVEGGNLIDELEVVDGILGANISFGDTSNDKMVHVVVLRFTAAGAIEVDRRMRVLRRLSPTGTAHGPWIDEVPDVTRTLTALDRRIIGLLVKNPNASLTQVARLLGVTLKTLVRRRSALLDAHALFYRPNVDWTKHPSVTLLFFCWEVADVDRVKAAVTLRFPHFLHFPRVGVGYMGEAYTANDWFAGLVPAHSPREVPVLVLELSRLPGVKTVRPEVSGPSRSFHRWANQRGAELLAAAQEIPPRRVGHAGLSTTKGRGRAPVPPSS